MMSHDPDQMEVGASLWKLATVISLVTLVTGMAAATGSLQGPSLQDTDGDGLEAHLFTVDHEGREDVVHATSEGVTTTDYVSTWVELDDSIALSGIGSTSIAFDYLEGENNANAAPD